MIEYRTQPLETTMLLEELSFYCQVLADKGIETTNVMFGWDSNLDIDDMWHEMSVPRKDVVDFVLSAERAGTVIVGRSDVFVSAGGLEFTLCHESDVHIKATADAANEFFDRWKDKGYSPYAVQPRT
jgi:hypothetical protein